MYEFATSRYGLGQDDETTPETRTPMFNRVTGPAGTFERTQIRLLGPSGLYQDCACYKNLPREAVASITRPWAMEFDTGTFGDRFGCTCNTVTRCPQEMQPIPASPDYASKKKQCDEWEKAAKTKKPEADRDIENEQFRLQMAQQIARAANIPAWRLKLTGPAEFLTVVEERSRRGTGIWIFSTVAVAAGGGFLLWKYLRGRRGRKETR